MNFDPTELPAWRRNTMDVMFPPWNIGVLSSDILNYVTRNSTSSQHVSEPDVEDMQKEFNSTGGLSSSSLKKMHRRLHPSDPDRGKYRKCFVETSVLQPNSEETMVYLEPSRISGCMIEMLRNLKIYVKRGENAFKIAAWFTATFLAIHPFQNGNGKVSRVALAVLLNRALGFHLSWPLDKHGRISYPKFIGAWALQKSQIPLSPGSGKPMVSVEIAPPVDFCAFLLDCAWVAVCPRVTRTIKLRGPPMCGKKTLLEMINRTDFENERFLKTPKFQYETTREKQKFACYPQKVRSMTWDLLRL